MNNVTFPEGKIYPDSFVTEGEATYFLAKMPDNQKCLGVMGNSDDFTGIASENSAILICPISPENARVLRSRLAWLKPVPLGRQTSFGFGDRIGWATSGHIRAMHALAQSGKIAPIYAQQSVRENTRIGRTPQQVLDDAMWGVFQMGWRLPWGADADHVKELAQLPPFVAAGYTFYTIDPSDHVDNAVQPDGPDRLRQKAAQLPWDILQTTYDDMVAQYCGQLFELENLSLRFDEETLLLALVKYGRAIAHTRTIAQALTEQMAGKPFDLEMSVDETDTPTSIYDHFYIVNELKRLDVPVISVAPRFVGKFQKGVDYMGDLAAFEAELIKHVAIMNHFGSYKLSVHTGSDKFSIYPIIAKHAQGLVHVKTAGTSYLEAVRVIAQLDPAFFRRILAVSRARFEKDRKTYFLDGQLSKVPADEVLSDADLPDLLEQFDSRQVLHVTFGSILDQFDEEFHAFVAAHEAAYERGLEAHFVRHLRPFSTES